MPEPVIIEHSIQPVTDHRRLRLTVILGSNRPERICPAVADWFLGQARRHPEITVDLDVCDLAVLALPPDLSGGDDTETFTERIDDADAVVIITPEYNHGYPGVLKIAIDTVWQEWRAKPVGFVCYGGVSGGLRAVEQLRGVFGELHAVTLRDTVSMPNAEDTLDQCGQLHPPQRANSAADMLLRSLRWWARATQEALRREPYPTGPASGTP
jgi:NAD(P)H-dependent FMN reductase